VKLSDPLFSTAGSPALELARVCLGLTFSAEFLWLLTNKIYSDEDGMLTLDAGRRSGTVWATVPGHGKRYGRWEARVRSEQNGSGGAKYRVLWELVPAGDYRCGTKNPEISGYHVGDRSAKMRIRR
jgi:hypothetical protein